MLLLLSPLFSVLEGLNLFKKTFTVILVEVQERVKIYVCVYLPCLSEPDCDS